MSNSRKRAALRKQRQENRAEMANRHFDTAHVLQSAGMAWITHGGDIGPINRSHQKVKDKYDDFMAKKTIDEHEELKKLNARPAHIRPKV